MKNVIYRTEIPIDECEQQWHDWPKGIWIQSYSESVHFETDHKGQRFFYSHPRFGRASRYTRKTYGSKIYMDFDHQASTVTLRPKRMVLALMMYVLGWVFIATALAVIPLALIGEFDLSDNWIGFIFIIVLGVGLLFLDQLGTKNTMKLLDEPIRKYFGGVPINEDGKKESQNQ